MKRADENGPIRKVGSGRVAKIMTKPNIRYLKTMFDHKGHVSGAMAARKFKCTQQYVSKTLITKTGIR